MLTGIGEYVRVLTRLAGSSIIGVRMSFLGSAWAVGVEWEVSDIEPLPVVYAYRVLGPMLGTETRWSPQRVECTEDREHATRVVDKYVVKFRRDGADKPAAAAMNISELIAIGVVQSLGFRCLTPALVYASHDFSASCTRDAAFGYNVAEGYHFGTMHNALVMPGPPVDVHQMTDPYDLVRIWVVDCWLMNRDRTTYGNILLDPQQNGKWGVIPVDHSECFYGARTFCHDGYVDTARQLLAVDYLDGFERLVMDDCGPLKATMKQVQDCAQTIRSITQFVPGQWWDEAEIDQSVLEECLQARAKEMHEICQLSKWEGIQNATAGGQILLLQ